MATLRHMMSGRKPLILDGAMGTELGRRGVPLDLPLWSAGALMTHPEVVRAIHEDYIGAGADIITTNTFRTTRRTLRAAGMPDRSQELTSRAVDLAREATQRFPGRQLLVAGSIAPLEDCYRPDLVPSQRELEEEHAINAGLLSEAGVDLLLLETMGTVREAVAACTAAVATGNDVVISFLCRGDGLLYGGDSLDEAVAAVAQLGPVAIGLNCLPAVAAGEVLRQLAALTSLPRALYANAGIPGQERGAKLRVSCAPDAYRDLCTQWLTTGVSIVGGCCGTTPGHIRAVARSVAVYASRNDIQRTLH
jgi:S-methylmethionine-dependent homocysteine/selenocysteine methylase